MTDRCSSAEFVTTGKLPNFKIQLNKISKDGSAKSNIVQNKNTAVEGAIYKLSSNELEKLDQYEGVGKGYNTRQIEVNTNEGKFDCVCYIGDKHYLNEELCPYRWYRELLLEGARSRDFQGLIKTLRKQDCFDDPNPNRATRIVAENTISNIFLRDFSAFSSSFGKRLLDSDTKIAATKSVESWIKFRDDILNNEPNIWQRAYENYFYQRIKTRYFDPIRFAHKIARSTGEGFAIVTLQCALVEFLGSLIEGKLFTKKEEGKCRLFEYNSSKKMMRVFFDWMPGSEFENSEFDKFYECIRCGLFHEARTKGDWKIWLSTNHKSDVRYSQGKKISIDFANKIVYRDLFQNDLYAWVKRYKERLLVDDKLQKAFVRRFDGLCISNK